MGTKVLLVGSGGREDAVARCLVRSGASLYSAIKNRNPSIISLSKEHIVCEETDFKRIQRFAVEKGVELAFIGPDPVLETELVERLVSSGIAVASPDRKAARIETSKEFMRDLMTRYSIPGNIPSIVFRSVTELKGFLKKSGKEYAIKPIGLTGGKGVKVMGDQVGTMEEAVDYASSIIGRDGRVLLEERVTGEEFSLQVFTDGTHVKPMPVVQDFKRAYENDAGPNTGGMGSISGADGLPFIRKSSVEKALNITSMIIDALKKEGSPFRGVLYGQFMDTENGPVVIEINSRFADPESMNVLSLMKSSIYDIFYEIANGNLHMNVEFEKKATVLKYIVPRGYGTKPETGVLTIERKSMPHNLRLYYAAVSGTLERVEMSTSRSLAMVGIADTIPQASDIVEENLHIINGNYYVRHDIGSGEMMERKASRTLV
ncbi:phosphoribosylamine--glycine ligase [Oxyplasma meridianum]|uniref:phosphoribosylamine--glycine ligase n=1 Tax=Oxyplasma meridianum TaxID=3073602 RepID=A0AAX4NGE2_9ARCH